MSQRKVMVIGLDSATLELARPWAAEGRLPNLARFIDSGAHGTLLSTLPAISPAAWSSFATGMNPGKTSIIDFCQLSADSYQAGFVSSAVVRGRQFWQIAGEQGVRGGVINVPVTYPPRPYNGFIITGLLSPGVNRRMASPPEILDDLLAASSDYAVDVNVTSDGVRDIKAVFMDTTLAVIEARTKAAVGLYRKHRPPLFVVAFTASDRICHYFWNYHQAMMDGQEFSGPERRYAQAVGLVYEALDRAVGELAAEAGDDTDILIMSDHGAGPLLRGINLRKVLVRAGLMVESRPSIMKKAIVKFAKIAPMTLKSRIKAHFKGLTGRDPITARHLNKEEFTFLPNLKLFISLNEQPAVHDQSVGFWERPHLIPFNQCYAEHPDRTLKDKLLAEGRGILWWMVQGCLAWQKEGLARPKAVQDEVQAYKVSQAPLTEFISERLVVKPELECHAAQLYDEYKVWADERRLNGRARLTRTRFGREMGKVHEKTHTRKGTVYLGVGLGGGL